MGFGPLRYFCEKYTLHGGRPWPMPCAQSEKLALWAASYRTMPTRCKNAMRFSGLADSPADLPDFQAARWNAMVAPHAALCRQPGLSVHRAAAARAFRRGGG